MGVVSHKEVKKTHIWQNAAIQYLKMMLVLATINTFRLKQMMF